MKDPLLSEASVTELLDEVAQRLAGLAAGDEQWHLTLHVDAGHVRKVERPASSQTRVTLGRSALERIDERSA